MSKPISRPRPAPSPSSTSRSADAQAGANAALSELARLLARQAAAELFQLSKPAADKEPAE